VNSKQAESGFTLVEVLIASAILIASIGVILQLFASGLDRMHRAGVVGHRMLLEQQIVNELNTINPALKDSGEGSTEGWHYRWRAKAITKFQSILISGQTTEKTAALFNVHVDLMQKGKPDRSFELLLLGWR